MGGAALRTDASDSYVSSQQLARLQTLLADVLPHNSFQRAHLGSQLKADPRLDAAAFARLPMLRKSALVADVAAHPPFGSNLTWPLARYTRFHQTSGTTGTPLPVLDTPESWSWWGACWQAVFAAGEVTANDRLYFAFSFGPFVGFWAAYQGATTLGALCIPGGGATSSQRLQAILKSGATVLLCTPSYALRLAEVARAEGVDLRGSSVRLLIVAGEAGGSVPAIRGRLAEAWGAAVLDHAGASEVGAWGIGCDAGLRVNESEFIAEVIDGETGARVAPGSGRTGELVLTPLGRAAWPVVRYRTGDVVRPTRVDVPGHAQALVLEGGVLGRADDMITVRGVNVFPSAVEDVVRGIAGVAEFRITATRRGALDELSIDAEIDAADCERLAADLRSRIGIRVEVRPVDRGALPRFDGGEKARRFIKVHDDTQLTSSR